MVLNPDNTTTAVPWKQSGQRRTVVVTGIACLVAVVLPVLIAFTFILRLHFHRDQELGSAEKATANAQAVQDQRAFARDAAQNDLVKAQQAINRARSAQPPEDLSSLFDAQDRQEDKLGEALTSLRNAQSALTATKAAQASAEARARMDDVYTVSAGLAVAGAFLAAIVFSYVRLEKKRQYHGVMLLAAADRQDQAAGDPLDPLHLWQANRQQLGIYHGLVQGYASSTRQLTLFTLVAGFGFLLLVGAATFFVRSIAAAVVGSVIAAAAAAMTAYIGNAVLRNSETSSQEVRAFFAHPLEVERTLTAERIVRSMPESARDSAHLAIVMSLVRATQEGTGTTRPPAS